MADHETPEEILGLKYIKLTEDDLANVVFIGTVSKFEEFLKIAENCIETIKKSDNIRLIVLETWLLIDYGVRELLLCAIDSSSINRDDYDLRYKALPSFRACISLLVKIKQTNTKLPPDPDINAINLPVKFFSL